jgi:hypothetical protein
VRNVVRGMGQHPQFSREILQMLVDETKTGEGGVGAGGCRVRPSSGRDRVDAVGRGQGLGKVHPNAWSGGVWLKTQKLLKALISED